MVTGDDPDDPAAPVADPWAPAAGEDPAPLKPDPKPRAKRPRSRKRAPQAKINDIRDEMEVLFTLGAGIWSVRDPHCGGVLNAQAKAIATNLAEQMASSPKIMEWFDVSVGLSGWIKLYLSAQPVAQAFFSHHITKSAGQEDDGNGVDPLGEFPAWTPGDRYAS
jgi:hypothetical protein